MARVPVRLPGQAAGAAAPAPPPPEGAAASEFKDKLKAGSDGPAMVWIPAGTFDMGSPGSSGNAEERPRHAVKIGKFAMSKYEVTFAEYEKFAAGAGRNPRRSQTNFSTDGGRCA